MARTSYRSLIEKSTPKELFEKYKDKINPAQFTFVNLIVLHNMRRIDAMLVAYPQRNKWTPLSLRTAADNMLSRYLNPFVRQYYEDLVEAVQKEFAEQSKWTKERAIASLVDIVEKVDEEMKPILVPGSNDLYQPVVSKPRMDAKISAISELNKLSGFTNNSKLEVEGKVVVFKGEDEIDD